MSKYFIGKFVGFFVGIITAYTMLFAFVGIVDSAERIEALKKDANNKSIFKKSAKESTSGMFN